MTLPKINKPPKIYKPSALKQLLPLEERSAGKHDCGHILANENQIQEAVASLDFLEDLNKSGVYVR